MDAPRITKDRAKTLRRTLSLPEVLLWNALKRSQLRGLQFRKQHPLGPYILDFYCDARKLAVEVDGGSHGFGDRPRHDQMRDTWLLEQGIRILRISARTVLTDVSAATRTVEAFLDGSYEP